MRHLFRPKRNGKLDNLLGALCCLVAAAIIYAQPLLHAVCATTRIGVQKYLWFCVFPVMTMSALILAAVLFPILNFVIGKLSSKNRMGYGTVSVLYGVVLAFCVIIAIPFEPDVVEMIPQAFLAGFVAGLVFAFSRDHLRSAGRLFERPSSGDNAE